MVSLLPLFGVWLLAVISPGPDFLVTVQYAVSRSRRHGMQVGLGVSTAILVWATTSMLGLSVVLARLSWLYDIVRLAGSGYLVYLGVRTLWSSRRRGPKPSGREPGTPASGIDPESAPTPPTGLARAWRVGFLTNIGNPKAAVFFGSLLGALLPAAAGVALRIAVVLTMTAIALTWFTTVAALFGLPSVAGLYRRCRRWIDRIMAAILVLLGGRLALDR